MSNMTLVHTGKQAFNDIDVMELLCVMYITFLSCGIFGCEIMRWPILAPSSGAMAAVSSAADSVEGSGLPLLDTIAVPLLRELAASGLQLRHIAWAGGVLGPISNCIRASVEWVLGDVSLFSIFHSDKHSPATASPRPTPRARARAPPRRSRASI